MPPDSDLQRRKVDHLELCATDAVAFRDKTTLLECVRLVHQSLPELSRDDLDLSVTMLGKTLRAPLMIAGMTGGTERSAEVNHELSAIAEARGIGFGLGSQKAMHREPDTAWTYQVRQHAPTTLLLGNVGVVHAREVESAVLAQLVEDIGADGRISQPHSNTFFNRGIDLFPYFEFPGSLYRSHMTTRLSSLKVVSTSFT
jgi:isopentenyl-diphosphate delta-isomerase